MKNKFSGIFAPVTTPFLMNEEVDYQALRLNLQAYLSSRLNGLLILGSNAEYKSLSEEEKIKILKLASQVISGRKAMIVGLMYDSIYLAKQFINKISSLHIDCLLVQPPFYFKSKLTDDDYYEYYRILSEISPFPIIVYNSPGFTGIDFSEQLINRISELSQIAGIKDSSKTEKQYSTKLAVLTGTINTLYEMLDRGAIGGIVSIANYIPELPVRICSEFSNTDKGQAKILQEIATKLNNAITGKNGVAGVKAAMDSVGLQGGNLRKPLNKLSPAESIRIGNLIREFNANTY